MRVCCCGAERTPEASASLDGWAGASARTRRVAGGIVRGSVGLWTLLQHETGKKIVRPDRSSRVLEVSDLAGHSVRVGLFHATTGNVERFSSRVF